jgi:hypothetical protein
VLLLNDTADDRSARAGVDARQVECVVVDREYFGDDPLRDGPDESFLCLPHEQMLGQDRRIRCRHLVEIDLRSEATSNHELG